MLISGITGVEFLNPSGKAFGAMTLSPTRYCTFTRESSRSESEGRVVITDWTFWFKMLALSLVSVSRFPVCFRGGIPCWSVREFLRYWKSFLLSA